MLSFIVLLAKQVILAYISDLLKLSTRVLLGEPVLKVKLAMQGSITCLAKIFILALLSLLALDCSG
jgi:hypothetical protein